MASVLFPALNQSAEARPSDYESQLDALGRELGLLQREIRGAGVPVVVLFEGWEAAGKGTAINTLLLALDARGFKVHTVKPPTKEERLHAPLWRFWQKLPEAGTLAIFDRSWYEGLFNPDLKSGRGDAVADVVAFERTLTEAGCIILKFFLHISKEDQARRFKKLRADPATAWRVDKHDLKQNRHYDAWLKKMGRAIEATQSSAAPWQIISAKDKHLVALNVFETIVAALKSRLARSTPRTEQELVASDRVTSGPSALESVDLTGRVDGELYKTQLSSLRSKLRELEHQIYRDRLGVAIVFEGWDAAGKGGCIRRLVSGLDPRGYDVIPIAAPSDTERKHHYLRRFWIRMPKAGHIAIFDRSWYGRVLVERVEGFCSRAEWMRAYTEICDMERSITSANTIMLKFWMQIDREEQLRRFTARQSTPDKQYKITDEDWRNRERWNDYECALKDMFILTSTQAAPWTVVAANDKLSARLTVLETVAKGIEDGLKRMKRKT